MFGIRICLLSYCSPATLTSHDAFDYVVSWPMYFLLLQQRKDVVKRELSQPTRALPESTVSITMLALRQCVNFVAFTVRESIKGTFQRTHFDKLS